MTSRNSAATEVYCTQDGAIHAEESTEDEDDFLAAIDSILEVEPEDEDE